MSPKTVPFRSKGPKKKALLGGKDDGDVVDHGDLDNLQYEVFKRGANSDVPILVLHIIKPKKASKPELRFKKEAIEFEAELDKLDFENMKNGERFEIKGSGDNDNLIVKMIDGEIKFELKKRGFDLIEKVKHILEKNRQTNK